MSQGVTMTTTQPTTRGTAPPSFDCRDLEVTLHGAAGAAVILQHVDVQVREGEFLSILGTSGSGKTTLLRVLGGLQRASAGVVESGGRPVTGPPKGVVTVFQNYTHSLLPWRTVRKNVALGIEKKLSKQECAQRIEEALSIVNLESSADEYPWRLSGGMQQRVQLAAALMHQPRLLVLDEPFGAHDAMTKASLQDQHQQVQKVTGTTIVFVTHDVEEAVYLADRVIVIHGTPGRLVHEVRTELPRPRDQLATREHPEFLRLRHEVITMIRSLRQH
jgi:NitT/TauT family transport system ATP-binding protein